MCAVHCSDTNARILCFNDSEYLSMWRAAQKARTTLIDIPPTHPLLLRSIKMAPKTEDLM